MACYGYARVSSIDQDYALQEQALHAAGSDIVRAEKISGTSRQSRTELELLLQFLQPGDTLMVTRADRLARSIKDLQDIVYLLKVKPDKFHDGYLVINQIQSLPKNSPKQKNLMEQTGKLIADLIIPDGEMEVTGTETTFGVNLALFKIKRTVKKNKPSGNPQ